MKIREMRIEDIEVVLPLYISYYNEQEENNTVIGFAMGYFKQYDGMNITMEKPVITMPKISC